MNRLVALRAGYGALLLLAPDQMVRLYAGHRADGPARRVARLLGGRHLAQAVLTAGAPGRSTLALGVEADLAHAVSMAGVAVCDPARRRAGVIDALGAASFAAAGTWQCRRAPANSRELGTLAELRAAAAARLANRLLPPPMRTPRSRR